MNNYFIVKELKMSEEEYSGIQSISFVPDPAIEANFEYFASNKLPFFKYTAEPQPETIDTSHEFCKNHAGKIYHISEINNFAKERDKSFMDVDYFANFTDETTEHNIDQQLYNCRHHFRRVKDINEVPKSKIGLIKTNMEEESYFTFNIENEEKRQVQGLALKSNQFIFRKNADGKGNPGHVYFSRDTIRQLHKKFGFNRSISFKHREDITGNAILLDSWLVEDEKNIETSWYLKYQIIGEPLWAQVKSGNVRGFSIEAIMKMN